MKITRLFSATALAIIMACFSMSFFGFKNPVSFNPAHNFLNADTATRSNMVYARVDVYPNFPGGMQSFTSFVNKNLIYPKDARTKNISGKVFIQFIVEKDGSLTEMKVLSDPGSGLGDEAVRVLSISPKWLPGKLNGGAVRVQFTVPINFKL